jgi:hypothetical protein
MVMRVIESLNNFENDLLILIHVFSLRVFAAVNDLLLI